MLVTRTPVALWTAPAMAEAVGIMVGSAMPAVDVLLPPLWMS